MSRNSCWKNLFPPRGWWQRFEPAYVGAVLVVFAVGASQQFDLFYLAFALIVIIALLFHASWRVR